MEQENEIKKNVFDVVVNTRLSEKLINEIDKTMLENEGVYVSRSHFIRCAVIEKLRIKRC